MDHDELLRLRRENAVLRDIVRNMASVVNELTTNMPDNIKNLPAAQQALATTKRILKALDQVDA